MLSILAQFQEAQTHSSPTLTENQPTSIPFQPSSFNCNIILEPGPSHRYGKPGRLALVPRFWESLWGPAVETSYLAVYI